MEIQSTQPINFKAKLIKKVTIQKYNKNTKQYTPTRGFFLEFEPIKREAEVLDRAVSCWDYDKFGGDIAYTSSLITDGRLDKKNHKVYILSSQTDNFENLNPDNIEGLVEVEKKSNRTMQIVHLQTNPANQLMYNRLYNKPLYKGVGRAIVKSLQQINKNRSIILESIRSAMKFYEKLDFKLIDSKHLIYKWKR